MKSLDIKLKILAGVLGLGVLALVVTLVVQLLMTNVTVRYGSPAGWERYTSGINNVAFRVPEGFEVIPPVDFQSVPFSVVKAGERGESVLIQIGTVREEGKTYTSTGEMVAEYERRFFDKRRTLERVEFTTDGRIVVALVQEESSGRLIADAFAFDPAVASISPTGDVADGEVREISLQLPASTQAIDRRLYVNVYLAILKTVTFLADPSLEAAALPGIPDAWSRFADAGFSMFIPTDWELQEAHEQNGQRILTFATRSSEVNNNAAQLLIATMPAGQSTTIAGFLTEAFIQPFRDAALPGTLYEETLIMPGIGEAVSLEARRPTPNVPDADEAATLLVLVGGPNTLQPGRGYVLETTLPSGKAQELRLNQIRAITRSFRLISSAEE